jgi:hypothetical protein
MEAAMEDSDEESQPSRPSSPGRTLAVERKKEATRRNKIRRDAEIDITKKWCTLCLEDTPLDDYNKGAGLFGRYPQCRTCFKSVAKERRENYSNGPIPSRSPHRHRSLPFECSIISPSLPLSLP